MKDSSGKRAPTYAASSSQTNRDPGNPTAQTNSTPKELKCCHPEQPNSDGPYGEPATPLPSKPIVILSKRRMAWPGNSQKKTYSNRS